MPPQANVPLPPGYQLDEYRIERQLSLGGFSIVYLAFDEEDTPVAIKEYLPNSLALRAEGDVLPSIAEENVATFRYGMKCFFEEGRALARPVAPQCGARAEFLPRQRNSLHGDALRARAHAAGAHPEAQGRDPRELHPRHLHAPAQRPARSAHAQAAAPRHQAVQHLPAQRRHAGADRFRRRAPDAGDSTHRCSSRCTRPASPRRSNTTTPGANCSGRGATSTRVGASMYACIGGSGTAGSRRAPREGPVCAGSQALA